VRWGFPEQKFFLKIMEYMGDSLTRMLKKPNTKSCTQQFWN
jgi:hypothetical protein